MAKLARRRRRESPPVAKQSRAFAATTPRRSCAILHALVLYNTPSAKGLRTNVAFQGVSGMDLFETYVHVPKTLIGASTSAHLLVGLEALVGLWRWSRSQEQGTQFLANSRAKYKRVRLWLRMAPTTWCHHHLRPLYLRLPLARAACRCAQQAAPTGGGDQSARNLPDEWPLWETAFKHGHEGSMTGIDSVQWAVQPPRHTSSMAAAYAAASVGVPPFVYVAAGASNHGMVPAQAAWSNVSSLMAAAARAASANAAAALPSESQLIAYADRRWRRRRLGNGPSVRVDRSSAAVVCSLAMHAPPLHAPS